MKRGKRFLSLLLVFIMVFSMLPSTTALLAAELSSYTGVTIVAGNNAPVIAGKSKGVSFQYGSDYLSVTTTDANDPYFTIDVVDKSLSGKVIAVKTRAAVNGVIANGWLYPETSAGSWGPGAAGVLNKIKIPCDGLWNLTTYTVASELMGASTTSVGTATQTTATLQTFRIGGLTTVGKTIDIAYIGVFDSIAQAKEYDDLFCKVYTSVQSGRVDIIPSGWHYVPSENYNFQESAVTNGLKAVTASTNLNLSWTPKSGTGESTYVVSGTNKYLRLKYDSIKHARMYNSDCPYVFSADVMPETAASHFAGFIFNYGFENDWEKNTFFETNNVEGNNSVGQSGILVNIHPAMIEVMVITYNDSTKTLGQIKYTYALSSTISSAFHNFTAKDDANGTITFALDGKVFASVKYEDPSTLLAGVDKYNERYYRTAKICDASGTVKTSTSYAMISYVKSLGMGSRHRAINIDNVKLGQTGTTAPSFSLSGTSVAETSNINATIKYGDYTFKDLWLGVYNNGDVCGTGMGTVNPMNQIALTGQTSVALPKLPAGSYYATIMGDGVQYGSKIYFTVTDVAKTQKIYVEDTDAVIGSTVRVPVRIASNPGLKKLTLKLSWDSSVFTPVSASNGLALASASFSSSKTSTAYTLNWTSTSNITTTGILAYVEFKVNSTANLGQSDISVQVVSATSGTTNVTSSLTTASGRIKVRDNDLKFDGVSLSLSSDITVNYLVKQSLLQAAGYTNPYMEVVLVGETTTVQSTSSLVDGESCYVFSFTGLAPQSMNDVIYATLIAQKDGVESASKSMEYKVSDFIYLQIEETKDEYLKTLLVDLINFGAAAQVYANYNTLDLINTKLTEEQQAYGTATLRPLTGSITVPETSTSDKAQWQKVGLIFKNRIGIVGYFVTSSLDGGYLRVDDSDRNVLRIIRETGLTVTNRADGSKLYSFEYDSLAATQLGDVLQFTVCDKSGNEISGTYVYSIESYIKTVLEGNPTKTVKTFLEEAIKYGDSAKMYVAKQEEPADDGIYGGMEPVDIGSNFYANIVTTGSKHLTLSGTNVVLGAQSGSSSQLWQFLRLGNGAYRIVNANNKYCLDVAGAGTANGTNVQTYVNDGTEVQKWYLYLVDGSYVFRPAHSDTLAMNVANASFTDGANIEVSTMTKANSQKFAIENRTIENVSWVVKNSLGVQSGGEYTDYNAAVTKANELAMYGYAVYDNEGAFVYAKDGKVVANVLTHAKSVADYARVNGWRYGDARKNPYFDKSEKVVSCDRFVSWVLGNAGYTNGQPATRGFCLLIETTLQSWCANTYGFTKITDASQVRAGDIVFVGDGRDYGAQYANNPYHTFIAASANVNNTSWRYDFGSDSRIQSVQPTNEQFDKGAYRANFRYAYRPK